MAIAGSYIVADNCRSANVVAIKRRLAPPGGERRSHSVHAAAAAACLGGCGTGAGLTVM